MYILQSLEGQLSFLLILTIHICFFTVIRASETPHLRRTLTIQMILLSLRELLFTLFGIFFEVHISFKAFKGSLSVVGFSGFLCDSSKSLLFTFHILHRVKDSSPSLLI